MVLNLYGVNFSTCTQRVRLTAAEKQVDFNLIPVDLMKGEHKGPEHLTRQPFGRIPALEDGSFSVFESRAIAKYLAIKYANQGTPLIPDIKDIEAFAKFEQGCSIELSYFDPVVTELAYELVFKGMKGEGSTDEAKVKVLGQKLDEVLKVYDVILGKQKYIGGDQLTLADIYHLSYGTRVRELGYKSYWEKYPNVNRWWDELMARESAKKVLLS